MLKKVEGGTRCAVCVGIVLHYLGEISNIRCLGPVSSEAEHTQCR